MPSSQFGEKSYQPTRFLNEYFMGMAMAHEPMRDHLDPYMTTFEIWIEGTFTGLIATFVLANSIKTKPATSV